MTTTERLQIQDARCWLRQLLEDYEMLQAIRPERVRGACSQLRARLSLCLRGLEALERELELGGAANGELNRRPEET